MGSILSDINTSLNYGDEVSKLYGTLGNEFYCGGVQIYRTDKPNGIYNNIFDINDIYIECIFKDEIIKYANSDIWDDYPIKNSRIYDDLGIVFSFRDVRNISDSSKYIIEHLIRTVYMNRSILDKTMNYDWDNCHTYMDQKTLSMTGDVELNDEIYPLLKRDSEENEFDFQVYVEALHTPSFGGFYSQHNSHNVYKIKIKIPFKFYVGKTIINHCGFIVLDLLPRVKKLSDNIKFPDFI
jgi:hypothetical protein